MVRSALKRCPFCDSLATYVWDEIDKVWMAGCTNKRCIVSIDSLYTGFEGFTKDIKAAGRIWNKRAKVGECHDVSKTFGRWQCSNCGRSISIALTDDPPCYCAGCGFKVVSE